MGIKEKEKEAMVEAGRELTRKPMFPETDVLIRRNEAGAYAMALFI